MIKKPLSETKMGILLSSIAGIAGGPVGVVVSPLVLTYINKIKKSGNRFLVWSLIGVPASVGLLIAQFIALAMFALMHSSQDYNGMDSWSGSQAAREIMQDPDWCVRTLVYGPPDGADYFYCYKRDMVTLVKNDHKAIFCHDEDFDGNYNCTSRANKQFSTDEMNVNKRLYGPQ